MEAEQPVNKATSAKYLRDLADKIESGKATCYVVAHLETCDNCPDQHSQIGTWLDPAQSSKLSMMFVGLASFVHGYVTQHVQMIQTSERIKSLIAQHEAKTETKQ